MAKKPSLWSKLDKQMSKIISDTNKNKLAKNYIDLGKHINLNYDLNGTWDLDVGSLDIWDNAYAKNWFKENYPSKTIKNGKVTKVNKVRVAKEFVEHIMGSTPIGTQIKIKGHAIQSQNKPGTEFGKGATGVKKDTLYNRWWADKEGFTTNADGSLTYKQTEGALRNTVGVTDIYATRGRTLDNLGFDDIGEYGVSDQLLHSSYNQTVQDAYKMRRHKLNDLQDQMRELLSQKKLLPKEIDKVRSLAREIKIVTVTDPTVMFQYTPDAKGNNLRIHDKTQKGWTYFNETKWKAFDTENLDMKLAPHLETLEAHHINGIDKYYNSFRNISDGDLFFLHEDLASRGHFFGNHPLNREFLDKSRHVGRYRQGTPAYESIHGMMDYADLADESTELARKYDPSVKATTMDQVLDRLYTDPYSDVSDIGSPGNPNVQTKRALIPSQEFWDDDMLDMNHRYETIAGMADNDKQVFNQLMEQPVKTELLYRGDRKGEFTKRFINRHSNITEWSPEVRKAMADQNLAALMDYDKVMDPVVDIDKTGNIKRFTGVNTLGRWSKAATGFSAAESTLRLASGDVVGGTIGLLMQTPTFQKEMAKAIAKVGAKTGVRMIPGVSFGSGALQAAGYFSQGKWTQAGLSMLGGVVGELGPAGDAAQAAIELGLTGHDLKIANVNTDEINRVRLIDEDDAAYSLRKASRTAARAF